MASLAAVKDELTLAPAPAPASTTPALAMSGQQRPLSSDDTRHHIVQSLFSRVDESGTADETLISFLKVYEDEGPGEQKTRYLMLAVTKFGKVVMHKAKRNNNLSFSKGKTWQLDDVRALEVIGPVDFALTMTIRRYHWSTDRDRDQYHFLNSVAKVYKTYTKQDIPELINFTPAAPPMSASGPAGGGPGSAPLSASGSNSSITRGAPMQSPLPRNLDLAPPPRLKDHRSGSSSSLASSAAGSHYMSERSHSQNTSRPSIDDPRTYGRSPLANPAVPLPAQVRRPSGPGSEMMRRPSEDVTRRPSEAHARAASPYTHSGTPPNHVAGLGMGMPTSNSQPSRLSVGEYMPSSDGRRPSGESGRPEQSRKDSAPVEIPRRTSSNMERVRSDDRPGSRSRNDSSQVPTTSIPAPKQKYDEVFEEDEPRTPRPADITSNSKPLAPPKITTTLASPATAHDPHLSSPLDPGGVSKNRPQRRASFHPPPLDTAFSREVLLTSRTGALPGAAGMSVADDNEGPDAIMNNVEDMLESFDWTVTTGAAENGRKKGSADAIESRLLDELSALDSANIHAFLESDDRISQVLSHIDEALLELDDIDLQITSYKMQLNAVSDDISYIESQNRGLQVQTSNQQALLNELRQLLEIAEVAPDDLRVLAQESPGSVRGVQNLERAAASLYKALQAGMDQANAEVAATIARMREYQENSQQFCKRIQDYLDIAFKHQSDSTLAEFRKTRRKGDGLNAHTSMGEYLMMYEGLVLYMKEMDEERYQRLCSNYMAVISELHQAEMKDLLMGFIGSLNNGAGDPNEASFTAAAKADAPKPSALQKSKAVMGIRGSDPTGKKEKTNENALRVAESYQKAISEMINQMVIEEDFINAFLHLTDTESTFADHMELDSYFRRQAARHASKAMSVGLMQLVRSTMDLVFGFVDNETKNWVEAAVGRDPITIVGVIAVTERVAMEAEQEQTSIFFSQLFEKQLSRQRAMLDSFIADQIRTIDGTKSAGKRRKGVAFFVRHFPVFVEKMEVQLDGADGLPIREKANAIYDKVGDAIFGTLSQIAKTDRGDGQAAEDKGQLNYHVIMIENMRHFVDDVAAINRPVLAVFLDRAQGIYDENMNQYIKLMLRRSFGRLIDFFDGVDRVLQTTPPGEVSLHPSCSKSVLKKLLKDYTAKDMRKAVDAMAKRVDKQFSHDDDGASAPDPISVEVINTVWKAITSELKKEAGRAQESIGRCYSDSNLGIEYGPGEVEVACKRAKG